MAISVEKLAKRWILQLTPDIVRIIVSKENVGAGVQMFGQIKSVSLDILVMAYAELSTAVGFIPVVRLNPQDRIFEAYHIESAAENNSIWMELSGELFVRALKSSQQASDVTMKLTKKQNLPTLSFSITNQSRSGKPVLLVQDVPIRVLSVREAEELKEPVIVDYQVHILLPQLHHVRTITERMKAIGTHLLVSANMSGEFTLKVETDAVKVETFFKNLINPELDPSQVDVSEQPSMNRNPHTFAEVRVDVRDFAKFLHSSVINPRNVVCCIIEGIGLMLYVYLGEGTDGDDGAFTYYIPMRSR
ncbi:hypothetical protein HK104_007379 [Borealophlyctis nickersoniae]|nr:hypothetical protein HK104_007379 [Borealophlyctis nickersoniae]